MIGSDVVRLKERVKKLEGIEKIIKDIKDSKE
jgi:hypothetical protein